MNAIETLLDLARCSGIECLTQSELAIMREHLATLSPEDRVRAVYPHGGHISDIIVDRVWTHLGKKPSADDYRAMATILLEAAIECEDDASELDSESPK